MARLINGRSLIDGAPSIIFTTTGAAPLFRPPETPIDLRAPEIDTRLDLQVRQGDSSITLSGTLSGDPFPSAEVFIVDSYGNRFMLTEFSTPIDPTYGPYVGVPGEQGVRLGSFEISIPKGEGGLCR
jgi:hypothetical protein